MVDDVGETRLALGTRKGLFLLRSHDRRTWQVQGPQFAGVDVYDSAFSADGRTLWSAPASMHWGPTVQRSDDFGETWRKSDAPPAFPEGSGLSVARTWKLVADAHGVLWAGVEPAGLFRSDDGGLTWKGVDGFNAQPGREDWMPGGGGLCLHTILPHPVDPQRMVVAASAVGIFETQDGGASWRLRNGGIRADYSPTGQTREDETGSCPHKLARDAEDPDLLYMQNHCGVYRRREGETEWTDINDGLPSRFGFPIAAHPRKGGTAFTLMLTGDFDRVTPGGALAVHRTRDGGKSWERLAQGLPQKNAWLNVLRDGMTMDTHDSAGLYFGTTTGQLYGSIDEGENWRLLADHLPQILSVRACVVR